MRALASLPRSALPLAALPCSTVPRPARQPCSKGRARSCHRDHGKPGPAAPMASSDGGAAAAAAAAAVLEAPAALWQRITERYDAAQRDAAATMTETNTGALGGAGRAGASALPILARLARGLHGRPPLLRCR